MPYKTIDDLPESTKDLTKHEKEIFLAAFNSAFEQYKDEEKAFAVAWAAVNKQREDSEPKERLRCLNRTLKNLMQRGDDGSFVVRDVPLLAEGTWTDSAVQTPLFYPAETLKKCAKNWVLTSIWSRHSGGSPRSVTDKVGEIENIRFDESLKAVMGDLRFHCKTQASMDCAALVEGGFINAVSVEHGGAESYNKDMRRYEAEELQFYGIAMVDKGACEKCVIKRNSAKTHDELIDNTPSEHREAGGKRNMEKDVADKFAEIEARLAALENKPEGDAEDKEMSELKESFKKLSESHDSAMKEMSEKLKKLELTPNRLTAVDSVAEKLEFIN